MQEDSCSGFVGRARDFSCYFLFHFIKNFLVKKVFSSYHLKLSLPVFLKCFLILPNSASCFL